MQYKESPKIVLSSPAQVWQIQAISLKPCHVLEKYSAARPIRLYKNRLDRRKKG
jgi:hypothetical protein